MKLFGLATFLWSTSVLATAQLDARSASTESSVHRRDLVGDLVEEFLGLIKNAAECAACNVSSPLVLDLKYNQIMNQWGTHIFLECKDR
jgi:hypothetical protein